MLARGGRACRYPAYLVEHGGLEPFDLEERRWVAESERWPSEEDDEEEPWEREDEEYFSEERGKEEG